MSAFTGTQPARAAAARRAKKRADAELRNAATPYERTAKYRRDRARVQAALADAHNTQSTGANE